MYVPKPPPEITNEVIDNKKIDRYLLSVKQFLPIWLYSELKEFITV